ncbi:MspA family porin [Gordonia paraffinivorans]|uniref:MspA family porin n=1 Tax=Gordonia paraffinivorans TaxID=175628 RepID=UPI0014466991|nr:MspA family porin [Gordonia paraffinivorans]
MWSATLLAAVIVALVVVIAGAGPAASATHSTRDGHTIVLNAAGHRVRSVAPLDGSPLSREAFVSSDVHAAVLGIEKGESVRATLEVGYQIGYPVSIAPDGVTVTAHTPQLKLTSGVNAKLAPNVTISGTGGGSIGEVGGKLEAEATIIPSADVEFKVGAGKIAGVKLAEIALTRPTADIVLSGIELSVSNALGAVNVRPYDKISVTTDTGVYVYSTYGTIKKR